MRGLYKSGLYRKTNALALVGVKGRKETAKVRDILCLGEPSPSSGYGRSALVFHLGFDLPGLGILIRRKTLFETFCWCVQ